MPRILCVRDYSGNLVEYRGNFIKPQSFRPLLGKQVNNNYQKGSSVTVGTRIILFQGHISEVRLRGFDKRGKKV
jgi:hypothetical protein